MPVEVFQDVISDYARSFERLRRANPEVPVEVLLMTIDARALALEAQFDMQSRTAGA